MVLQAEEDEAVAAKRRRKERVALIAEIAELDAKRNALALKLEEVDSDDPAERKLVAKAARRAAGKVAAEVAAATSDVAEVHVEADPAEQKRLRREAKRAAAEAAAVEATEDIEVDTAEAKRLRKAAKRAAAEVTADATAFAATPKTEADATEAKRLKKAAKQAAAQAAAANDAVRNKSKNSSAALTVFVGCISFQVSEDTLWKDFSECGEIRDLNMPPAADGRPGGFAFITFKTTEGVDAALKYNGDTYAGRRLVVKIDGKIFVKGIPNSAQDAEVQEFFAACGEIQSCNVPRWLDGGAKGTAHINFKTREGLEKALALNGTLYGTLTLSVQKAAQGKGGEGKGKGEGGKGK